MNYDVTHGELDASYKRRALQAITRLDYNRRSEQLSIRLISATTEDSEVLNIHITFQF